MWLGFFICLNGIQIITRKSVFSLNEPSEGLDGFERSMCSMWCHLLLFLLLLGNYKKKAGY